MNFLDIPARTVIGADARTKVGEEARWLGLSKILLVSDPFHEQSGKVGEIVALLDEAGVGSSVYTGVTGEPDTVMVETGLEQYVAEGCDGLVALGGGSPIDTAKTIGVRVKNKGPVNRFMGLHKVPCTGVSVIAIPTSAGTGAEATKVVVITDAESQVKMMCLDRSFLPAVAIVDYKLSLSMPPEMTAAVGVDTLTHAIEAYVSRKANVTTDAIALSAIRLVAGSIRQAYHAGVNEEARRDMMLAAFQAGVAFSNSSVCLVHGMSRPLGACFHIPHGLSNSMLLPAVTKFSVSAAPGRYATVARAMSVADASESDDICCEKLVVELAEINREMNMQTPKTFGVGRDTYIGLMDKMAGDALASGSPANSPAVPVPEDIVELYRDIYDG